MIYSSWLHLIVTVFYFFINYRSGSLKMHQIGSRTVHTRHGPVRGRILTIDHHYQFRNIEQYLGIPYASPPVDLLRFMPPANSDPWTKVMSAELLKPVCPQILPDIQSMAHSLPLGRLRYLNNLLNLLKNQSEDCLYLNIYAPAGVGREPGRLPVMVYIHGESFEWNSGNPYDGSVLASVGNVVVVTLNYRLGIFGFLTTMDDFATGNYGLMDQIAALHWIVENIAKFGGDPTNITVFGHGSGASSIHLLMLSPVVNGLFQRVILMSGSALADKALNVNPLVYTRKLAEAVGCPVEDSGLLVHCLRTLPFETLINADLQIPKYDIAFGPIVDGIVIPNTPSFQLNSYHHLYSSYDLLIGVAKVEEYFHFAEHEVKSGIEDIRRNEILNEYIDHIAENKNKELLAVIVNEYTDWTKTIQHPINILDSVIEALGDAEVVAPLINTAQLHSKVHLKTYLYVFGYQTKYGGFSDRLGCIHGEELPYVFGTPLLNEKSSHFYQNYTSSEVKLSEAIMKYWTNFAKYGNPNGEGNNRQESGQRNRFNKFMWPSYEDVHQKYLSISTRPRIKDHYRAHKLSIWLNLVPQLMKMPSEEMKIDNIYSRKEVAPWLNVEDVLTTTSLPASTTSKTQIIPTIASSRNNKNVVATTSGNMTFDTRTSGDGDNEFEYSTALTLTIAVGCSLLVLNILAFFGMYYQQGKNRRRRKATKNHPKSSSKESLSSIHQPSNCLQTVPSVATIRTVSPTKTSAMVAATDRQMENVISRYPDDEIETVMAQNEKPTPPPRSAQTQLCRTSTAGTQV